jgi:hypothetical protein
MRSRWTICNEPRDAVYARLIEFASRRCSQLSLVLRTKVTTSVRALRVLESLHPFLRERRRTSEWPGTVLHGETAELLTYSWLGGVSAILTDEASGLYDWCQPELPEDLCLWTGAQPWLVSIAHEQDAYLELEEEEIHGLLDFVRDLRLTRDPITSGTAFHE